MKIPKSGLIILALESLLLSATAFAAPSLYRTGGSILDHKFSGRDYECHSTEGKVTFGFKDRYGNFEGFFISFNPQRPEVARISQEMYVNFEYQVDESRVVLSDGLTLEIPSLPQAVDTPVRKFRAELKGPEGQHIDSFNCRKLPAR